MKIMRASPTHHADRLAVLRREFYCTQALSHPNIVKVYELDRDQNVDFFTMELLDGEPLSDVMARLDHRPMQRAHAWGIITEIGAGLAHAHARRSVHADLKPHNIVITHGGELRILGFGAGTERGGFSSSVVGTGYASCELLEGRLADPRDDVYAFACIAYELLMGVHPFQRRPSTVARDLGIVPKRPPGLNWRQWSMLSKGLSWHRAGRSVAVDAFAAQLTGTRVAARQLPGVGALRSVPAPTRRPTASLKAATLFAAFPIAAGVGVLLLAHSGPTAPSDETPKKTPLAAASPAASLAEAVSAAPIAPTVPPVPNPTAAVSPARGAPATPPAVPAAGSMSAAGYTVHAGEHFAEIRVHRAAGIDKNTEFVWWTEPASARPGIDYVPLGKVTQSFPKGKSSTSFFIKLIPNASRKESQVFYVDVAAAGRGASSGKVAHAAVWLPTVHAQS